MIGSARRDDGLVARILAKRVHVALTLVMALLFVATSAPQAQAANGRTPVIFIPGVLGSLLARKDDPKDIVFGKLYAFEPQTGHLLWKFDLNPKDSVWELGGSGTRNNVISTPVFYNNRFYAGVGQAPDHAEGPGHSYALDATQEGDVTATAQIWHFGGQEFNRTISTAAIADGLLVFLVFMSLSSH